MVEARKSLFSAGEVKHIANEKVLHQLVWKIHAHLHQPIKTHRFGDMTTRKGT
nr:hypothetical protein [Candidatus Sigynarchaeota archaeon]